MTRETADDKPIHLRLEVVELNDRFPDVPQACTFAEQGGSIGRAEENDFVLPDTESVVSRTHARINYENGAYFLIDQSTNGTFVSDPAERLDPGLAHRIADGDIYTMGRYRLLASLVPAADPVQKSLHSSSPPGASVATVEEADEYGVLPEIEGMPGNAVKPSWFPDSEEIPAEEEPEVSSGDYYRERPPVPALQQHMPNPAPAHPAEDRSAAPQVERKPAGGGRPDGAVPTGYIPGSRQFDEFVDFELAPAGDGHRDDPLAAPQLDELITGEAEVNGAVEEDSLPPQVSPQHLPQSQHPAPVTSPPVLPGNDRLPPVPGTVDAQLLAALVEGLGAPGFQIQPDQAAAVMTQIGKLTREAIQGMIDTLRLRDEFRREFYVPVTRIAPTDNNIFKHSANVEDALLRAFSGAASSAYQGPVESTRQAFQDIAAHQLALVAGMQAALAFLLERFSPQSLEERIGKATVLDGVLPQIRKAHMWEQFEKEYKQIALQAEEDFQRAFGQHFERAYTEHIQQLHCAGFGGQKKTEP